MTTAISERTDVPANPGPLLQLLVGFKASQVLMTAHQLGIFEFLAEQSYCADTICQKLALAKTGGERLLQACVSFNLLEYDQGTYRNSSLSQRYLISHKSEFLGKFVDFYRETIYDTWAHLPEAVREGRPQMTDSKTDKTDFFSIMEHEKTQSLHFLEAMHNLGLLEGKLLAGLYPFERVNHLLDVGCGSGALGLVLAQSFPHLEVTLLDRPWVCEVPESHVMHAELEQRVHVVQGDFLKGPLPRGADTILLSMVLHDWDARTGIQILKRCYNALPSGGTLLAYEQLLDEDRCGSPLATLTSLTMLLTMSAGSEYSETDYRLMMAEAGFKDVNVIRSTSIRHLLTGAKP